MTITARTADHAPTERLEYWRNSLSEAFVPLEPIPVGAGAESLDGSLRHTVLGNLHIADVSGSAQTVQRHRALIRRRDPGWVKIGLQLLGEGRLGQGDREAVLAPGDFAAYDTSRPYTLTFAAPFRMLVLLCPRSVLRMSSDALTRATAVPISGQVGVGALVSPFLAGLGAMMDSSAAPLSNTAAQHLAESVLDMVTAGLTEAGTDTASLARCARPESLFRQLEAYLESNLHTVDLCPAAIAAAHHISVRYLQKLFGSHGWTVSGWVRSHRLERCRRDLADPRMAEESVSTVAARWGLTDPAYFSRMFRASYGVTPSEYRRAGHAVSI